MTEILRQTREWKRPRRESGRTNDLTPDEQAHVRAALRTLRVRAGGWAPLAAALKVSAQMLTDAAGKNGVPSAGLAVRAARFVGVPVDDLLAGRFPVPGSCPMCGRVG